MRTTVDIPDPLYRQLKSKAALDGKSVKELVLRGIDLMLQSAQPRPKPGKLKLPRLKSKQPGSLKLGKEGVYEYIPFP